MSVMSNLAEDYVCGRCGMPIEYSGHLMDRREGDRGGVREWSETLLRKAQAGGGSPAAPGSESGCPEPGDRAAGGDPVDLAG